nr:hypothetical protein [Tanacetum cinerariifolium]
MIVVNNQRDSVSPPPLVATPKKGKSLTVTSTLAKSQGPEASGALSKKSRRSKSKKPPTETNVTPPKPTEGSVQSHSVSSSITPDPQDLERNIQLASVGLPSTPDEGTRKSKPLLEGTATYPKDSGGNVQPLDRYLTFTSADEGMAKTMSRPEWSLGDKGSEGNIPPADMEPINPTDTDLSGTGAKYQVGETQSTRLKYQSLPKNKVKTCSEVEPDTEPLQLQTFADIQAFLLSKDKLDKEIDEEDVFAAGDDMNEDIQATREFRTPSPKQDHPKPSQEHHEVPAVSYADLNALIEAYYDENVAHKDQTGKLVDQTMSFVDRSITAIKVLYKGLEVVTQLLKDISIAVKDDPPTNKKIDEAIETFAKISSQTTKTALKREVSSLKQDTSEIKAIITEMYAAFEGQPSLAPSRSVTPTLALTDIQANVKGENTNTTAIEEPHSHTEGETEIDKGKGIVIESDENLSKKLVKASYIVRPDPDEPVRVEFMINGRLFYPTKEEIQEPEVIKVVQEEAKNLGINPKEAISTKAGEKFKKAQDAEHESTDTDGRIFDVHKPFLFVAFGIFKLDELRKIIPKKRNAVVKDLMNPLSQMYERLRQIPKKLGIQSALPAPVRKQALSLTSGRKRKHLELVPETRIPRLECNRALAKNVLFVNNMVIEEPEFGIFVTDEFGDQAFKRWSDIDKVGMEALVSYLVATSMVKSPENARFSMKLRKLITEHPDQEKLKSKKVKLECIRYKMDSDAQPKSIRKTLAFSEAVLSE